MNNSKKTPTETIKDLQEIATLSAKTLSGKSFERLTTNEVLLVNKLTKSGFLKSREPRNGKVGEATSID
jgi:hypothetical protein